MAEYVKENGAYAGMNGAYFCPPDYSSCNGKVNSSDYAFYDSNDGKWYNKHALDWNKTGLVVWNGNTPKFYKESTDYSTGDGATAGISNYPTLLDDGKYVAKDDDMTSYQKTGRGAKGVIGRDSENMYLAIIMNATVPDAGYVSKQIGMNDALNLDGGGSSAMYINGRYIIGPGRSLPSAIVIY